MIDLIMSLLTEYTQIFLNPDKIKYKNNKKCIKCMIKIVIAYSDLLEYLSDFYDIWSEWVKSNYDSTPYYYYIIPDIKAKLLNLMEYYTETSKILKYEDCNLDYNIFNFIWGKSTIFEVWETILKTSDDTLWFEHKDNNNKIMFIPNYSLILTDIKTVSKCSVQERESFIKMLSKKNEEVKNFHFSYLCHAMEHNYYHRNELDYVPILVEENYEFRDNPYIIKLHIPEDINYIYNFMSLIKNAIDASDKNMDICKKIIEKYNQEENKDLLQFILNS